MSNALIVYVCVHSTITILTLYLISRQASRADARDKVLDTRHEDIRTVLTMLVDSDEQIDTDLSDRIDRIELSDRTDQIELSDRIEQVEQTVNKLVRCGAGKEG